MSAIFACDLYALTPEQREHHTQTSPQLFTLVKEIRETEQGYQFRLPADTGVLLQAADFIAHERLCCPFFTFQVEVAAHGSAIWLGLAGVAGVKEFIKAELGEFLPAEVAAAAHFS